MRNENEIRIRLRKIISAIVKTKWSSDRNDLSKEIAVLYWVLGE